MSWAAPGVCVMNGPLLLQSLGLGILVTLGAFCLGWTVAVAAMGSGTRERKVWQGIAVAALALPPFWLANSWLELLSSVRLSIPKDAWDGWAFLATAGILTSMLWPIVTLSAWAAWGRLGRSRGLAPCLSGAASRPAVAVVRRAFQRRALRQDLGSLTQPLCGWHNLGLPAGRCFDWPGALCLLRWPRAWQPAPPRGSW